MRLKQQQRKKNCLPGEVTFRGHFQSYTEVDFVIVSCTNISIKNAEVQTRYICNEDGAQDNKFEMRVGLNSLFILSRSLSIFFMHIILLSLNNPRKATDICLAIL